LTGSVDLTVVALSVPTGASNGSSRGFDSLIKFPRSPPVNKGVVNLRNVLWLLGDGGLPPPRSMGANDLSGTKTDREDGRLR